MSKLKYEDWIDEDPFHPCLKCGEEDFTMDMTSGLYTCANCGEPLIAPKEPFKPLKKLKKKARFEDDWE